MNKDITVQRVQIRGQLAIDSRECNSALRQGLQRLVPLLHTNDTHSANVIRVGVLMCLQMQTDPFFIWDDEPKEIIVVNDAVDWVINTSLDYHNRLEGMSQAEVYKLFKNLPTDFDKLCFPVDISIPATKVFMKILSSPIDDDVLYAFSTPFSLFLDLKDAGYRDDIHGQELVRIMGMLKGIDSATQIPPKPKNIFKRLLRF